MDNIQIVAIVIFVITYVGIIFTRLPWINSDRPSAAFLGAVAMILFGVVSFDEAMQSIDFNTIALLFGMMVILSALQVDGFFNLVSSFTIKFAKTPKKLLVTIVIFSGLGSAFLVNDVVVLMLTPIVIYVCTKNKLNPIPYLIAEILAANVGSVMTITGNPQNMLIGINSGISYSRFLLHLFPISLIGLIFVYSIIIRFYPADFKKSVKIITQNQDSQFNIHKLKYSLTIFIIVIVLFFFSHIVNLSIPIVALLGASLVLLASKTRPSEIIAKTDWVLLLFFASIFIVVHGVEKTGVFDKLMQFNLLTNDVSGIGFVHALSLIMAQIISNVPFVIALLPVTSEATSDIIWLSLASASTLAGNATIIGAMVNLIVLEIAAKQNVQISFWEFFKSGIIVCVITFILSFFILNLQLYLDFL